MADQVKVTLLRPLDGKPDGSDAFYSEADAKKLEARGLVRIAKTKAEPTPKNKAEPKLANKAAD